MNRLALVVIVVAAAAACSKKSDWPPAAAKPEATAPAAPADKPAAAATGGFKLGEATVIELIDHRLQPTSRPAWKLHADGKTEHANDKTGEWRSELEVKPDGTVWVQGQQR